MKRCIKIFSIVFIIFLVLTGCTNQTTDINNKVVLVTHLGIARDKSFNEAALNGINDFAKNSNGKWKASDPIETKMPEEFVSNLESASNNNAVMVVTSGMAGYYKDVSSVAVKKSDRKYILVDIVVPDDAADNIIGLSFTENEAGFLAGVVAGLSTKTNKVAFLGGEKLEPVEKYGYGFIKGVQYVNPEITVVSDYAQSFKDVSVGKQKAESFYNSGVDILFVAASAVGTGAIDATKEQQQKGKEVWMIGVDSDQYTDGMIPGTNKSVILTSAMKKVGVGVESALNTIDSGNFKAKETLYYDIKNGGVGLPDNNPNLSLEIQDRINDIISKMKTGEISAPTSKEELDLSKIVGEI